MHTAAADGGNQCAQIVGNVDLEIAAALAVLYQPGLGGEDAAPGCRQKADLADRRHRQGAAVVGRHRKGKISQGKQHAAHDLTGSVAVFGFQRQAAFGIVGAAGVNADAGDLGGVNIALEKGAGLFQRYTDSFPATRRFRVSKNCPDLIPPLLLH